MTKKNKHSVMYVDPQGRVFTRESFKHFWLQLKEKIIRFIEGLKKVFRSIFKLVTEAEETRLYHKRKKHAWHVPRNTTRKSQVMYRKLIVPHVRNRN